MSNYKNPQVIFLLILLFVSSLSLYASDKRDYHIRFGIDVLRDIHFEPLEWKRTAVMCNQTSLNAEGRHILDILNSSPVTRIPFVYYMEAPVWKKHSLVANIVLSDSMVMRILTYPEVSFNTLDLLSIDALLFDIQLTGTVDDPGLSMLQVAASLAARYDLELIITDRPPMSVSDGFEGPWHPGFELPYRHGMTNGELAIYFGTHFFPGLRLTVIPLKQWRRSYSSADADYYKTPVDSVIYHPLQGAHILERNILRATNLWIDKDPEQLWFGSPSADPYFIKAKLSDIDPAFGKIQIKTIQTDSITFSLLSLDPVQLPPFYKLSAAMRLLLILYPGQVTLNFKELQFNTGSPDYGLLLKENRPLNHFINYWNPEYREFESRRNKILIYDNNKRIEDTLTNSP